MKKRFGILNMFLMLAVLSSMLLQSVHSYEHILRQATEKKCHHTSNSKSQITHQHHNLEHCFVCDFAFSSFIITRKTNFETPKTVIASGTPFSDAFAITQFFKGSLFSLRAPPRFFV
jgi:PP-loop superfamily ATP-utilizing enzyme